MEEILNELSISVACLLDDTKNIKEEDIHHIQDLITRLEFENWKQEKNTKEQAQAHA